MRSVVAGAAAASIISSPVRTARCGIIFMRGRDSRSRPAAHRPDIARCALVASDHCGTGLLIRRARPSGSSSGSSWAESAVEPTRSQNITVSWRRSASGTSRLAGGGELAATARGKAWPSGARSRFRVLVPHQHPALLRPAISGCREEQFVFERGERCSSRCKLRWSARYVIRPRCCKAR